jgi:hypothetical protein
MDERKRNLVRNSFFGALTTLLPSTMLEAVAAEATVPGTLDETVNALNKNRSMPSPVVFKDKKIGSVVFEKSGGNLKANLLGKNASAHSTPLADGTYSLGKMGEFSVKNGLVTKSKIDPLALKASWSEHSEIKIDWKKKEDLQKNEEYKSKHAVGRYAISER